MQDFLASLAHSEIWIMKIKHLLPQICITVMLKMLSVKYIYISVLLLNTHPCITISEFVLKMTSQYQNIKYKNKMYLCSTEERNM